MKCCYIMGAGEFPAACQPQPREGDFLIAADGGMDHLKRAGLVPDLLVGDFDSWDKPAPKDLPVRLLPHEKDDTDTGVAIMEGRARGYARFCLYGGVGGREDHTFANIQALVKLARDGLRGFLYGNGWLATAITDGYLDLSPLSEGMVSVFSIDNRCEGVSIQGLQYELDHVVLTNDYPLGVSNELTGRPARVSVEHGTLLIFCPASALDPHELP